VGFFGVEELEFALLRTEEIIPSFIGYSKRVFFWQVCVAGLIFDHDAGLSFHFTGFFISLAYGFEEAIKEIDQVGQDPVSDDSQQTNHCDFNVVDFWCYVNQWASEFLESVTASIPVCLIDSSPFPSNFSLRFWGCFPRPQDKASVFFLAIKQTSE
jgi:hypothetical protein